MTDFADFDPEDAYDSGDPVELRIAVLRRVAAALAAAPTDKRLRFRLLDALRLLDNLDTEAPGEFADELDELRADLEALA